MKQILKRSYLVPKESIDRLNLDNFDQPFTQINAAAGTGDLISQQMPNIAEDEKESILETDSFSGNDPYQGETASGSATAKQIQANINHI